MKKIVLKVDVHDGKDKRKALKAVSTLQGIDSIAMDMKERKMTVIGTVDPVLVVSKLRKSWQTDMVLLGPAKEEKKEGPKKEEPKKEEAKKEDCDKMKAQHEEMIRELLNGCKGNPYTTTRYYVQSMEDNPNSCVIC